MIEPGAALPRGCRSCASQGLIALGLITLLAYIYRVLKRRVRIFCGHVPRTLIAHGAPQVDKIGGYG